MKKLLCCLIFINCIANALDIQNLRAVPKDISAGDTVRIMFALDSPANVSLIIKNLNGNSITSLLNNVDLPAGQFAFPWTTPVNIQNGFYVPCVVAKDKSSGNVFAKQLDFNTAKMIAVPFKTTNLQNGGKKISFSIDKPALVSVRVGINNGPMYKIISNWKLTKPGSYSIDWDGWDNSRVLRVDNLANHLIDVRCIPVEINALQIRNGKKNYPVNSQMSAPELLKNIHAFIPEFNAAIDSSVKNFININIDVDNDTLDKLAGIPYEYVLYIDGERYGEIENAVSPFLWKIPRNKFSKGAHIFTIMLCTSIEQINSKSFKVIL